MRDSAERLRDTLDAIEALERRCPTTKGEFERDERLHVWLLDHPQILGEAPRASPDDLRSLAPRSEGSKLMGMRNVLFHGYVDIDKDIVWIAATRDVPKLKAPVERLLKKLEGHEWPSPTANALARVSSPSSSASLRQSTAARGGTRLAWELMLKGALNKGWASTL